MRKDQFEKQKRKLEIRIDETADNINSIHLVLGEYREGDKGQYKKRKRIRKLKRDQDALHTRLYELKENYYGSLA